MPVYRNTTDKALYLKVGFGDKVAAGGTATCTGYLWPIPNGFELVSNAGAAVPFRTLNNGGMPESELTNLAQYRQIIIYNGSGADLQLQANGDTTNTGGANLMILADGEERIIENAQNDDRMCDLNSLLFSGNGGGNIKVTGIMGIG